MTRLLEMAPLNQEVHLLLVAQRGRLGRESRLAPMAPQGQPVREGPVAPLGQPVREGPVAPLGQPVREGWRRQRTVLPSV